MVHAMEKTMLLFSLSDSHTLRVLGRRRHVSNSPGLTREIRVLWGKKTRTRFKASVRGCLQISRALYLVPPNSHVQPRVYVHARVECNATSLRRAGGCKRPNVPQPMHASPDFYQSIPGTRCMRQNHELSAQGYLQYYSHGKLLVNKSHTRICLLHRFNRASRS